VVPAANCGAGVLPWCCVWFGIFGLTANFLLPGGELRLVILHLTKGKENVPVRKGLKMRKLFAGLLLLGMPAFLIGVLGASASSASAAECSTNWGSLPKGELNGFAEGAYESVRTGRHTCYDRLVLEAGGAPNGGYLVHYVDQVVRPDSGALVSLRGSANLVLTIVASEPPAFSVTSPELANVFGYTTFRQVAGVGRAEGANTFIGLGVRARLPFRVFTLPRDGGGTRLVVDVAHHW
jgi:hypothetical protein